MQQKKSVTADTSVWDAIANLAKVNRRSATGEAGVALEVYVQLSKTHPELIREALEKSAPTS